MEINKPPDNMIKFAECTVLIKENKIVGKRLPTTSGRDLEGTVL